MHDIAAQTTLAELLCARLCHDLAGSVGAASAGAELLAEAPDGDTIALVAASVTAAATRLRFLRAALGPAGSEQPAQVLRDLSAGYLIASGGGLTLDWTCQPPRLGGDDFRLILNLIMLARDALPRGGVIAVDVPAAGPIVTRFTGAGAGLGDDIRRILDGERDASGPRAAQAWFVRCLAQEAGRGLLIEEGPGGGRIVA